MKASSAVLLVTSLASTAYGWTVNAYRCSDCTGCPPEPISGQNSALCTGFNFPVSSISSQAQVEGCQVYVYNNLISCQYGDGSGQQP